jgi:hypothetical protein
MRWLVKMTMGVCIMTWEEAKQEIKKNVVVGTDVNTKRSNYRIVKRVCDDGYIIPKGKKSNDMKVTWDMLKKCWNGMVDNGGIYDPKAVALPAPCYVQTIHMIFEKAGLT